MPKGLNKRRDFPELVKRKLPSREGVDSSHWREIPLQRFSFVAAFSSIENSSFWKTCSQFTIEFAFRGEMNRWGKKAFYTKNVREGVRPRELEFSIHISILHRALPIEHAFMDRFPQWCSQRCSKSVILISVSTECL